jgi:polyisoprenoid-binding protein YceI
MKLASMIFLGVLLAVSQAFSAEVDVTNSKFNWTAYKKLGAGHNGTISLKSANVKLDDKGMIQSGQFVIDMNSVTVTDLSGKWATKFLDHIKSGDFFDVKKFPEAKIVLKKQTKSLEVAGDMTIKDKTVPVTVKFVEEGNLRKGKFTFDRTKWGVVYGSGNFFKELTADKVIKNEVDIEFVIAIKEDSNKVAQNK